MTNIHMLAIASLISLFLFVTTIEATTPTKESEQAIIIEVTTNPHEVKEELEKNFPLIEVVHVYDELFQGLALKASPKQFQKLRTLRNVTGLHVEKTYIPTTGLYRSRYEALTKDLEESVLFPAALNDTDYTGKGVKVGVIDTGIDLNHPDLVANYKGGFDLVDLDDEPMETTEEEGMPTSHGSHVAGIIGAKGALTGVAPEADLYAYRALGPGGIGSSIHVIAAMERALKDGVDIMNLSLGNTVNGPDYPTSKAVVEAAKRGVAVVVANGNAGPDNWTIGAPATANAAFSVGAYAPFTEDVSLYDPQTKKQVPIRPLPNGPAWQFTRDYKVVTYDETKDITGKIVRIDGIDGHLQAKIKDATDRQAVAILIEPIEADENESPPEQLIGPSELPIAIVTEEDQATLDHFSPDVYVKTKLERTERIVAPFSSRGPVTINWQIKPNIIAPGVDVLSTVPKGYDVFSGTSMAAPHIAGVIALMKEARPNWTNEQLFAALETTAAPITDEADSLLAPFIQGSGLVQPKKAIEADVLIEHSLLTFGKIDRLMERTTAEITLTNVTEEAKRITFHMPPHTPGLTWELPQTFTLRAGEQKKVSLALKATKLFLQKGIHDDWLTIEIDDERIQMPYVFINETDSYKKVDGFSIDVHPFDENDYSYELHVAERARTIDVQLYDPETLWYVDTILSLEDVSPGMKKGSLTFGKNKPTGMFHGLIIVQLENGEIMNYHSPIFIP